MEATGAERLRRKVSLGAAATAWAILAVAEQLCRITIGEPGRHVEDCVVDAERPHLCAADGDQTLIQIDNRDCAVGWRPGRIGEHGATVLPRAEICKLLPRLLPNADLQRKRA